VHGCTLQQSPTSDCNSSDVTHSWSLNCRNFALGLIQCDLSMLHFPQITNRRIFSANGSKTIETSCPNFALSRHRKWANRRKHQHDAARALISVRGDKMPTVNEIATIGGLSQRAANVGKMAGICFATMGSGVRTCPGPPANPFLIKHIAVFVSMSKYPSKTTLPFFCPFAATRGFAQVRRRDSQPLGIIRSGRNYPARDLRIMCPSEGTESKENQSAGSADSGITSQFLQPPHNPDSTSNRLPDEGSETGGEE
jgi:hypothetical protein